jgi:hypothetical protein
MQVISFLHQMVETLGSAVFPALPTIIQQLLTDCEVRFLTKRPGNNRAEEEDLRVYVKRRF